MHANIRGQVQGVGFRYFACRQALALGVHGWVRNRPDGSVEIEAEGDPGSLDRLAELLRHGPTGARVADVELEWGESPSRFAGFDIVS